MKWIFLLYVLPLVLDLAIAYFVAKRDKATIKDFLSIVWLVVLPLANILLLLMGGFLLIVEWIENDESIQNFLDKKL